MFSVGLGVVTSFVKVVGMPILKLRLCTVYLQVYLAAIGLQVDG